jgi:NADH-quinone oxidoreductase subunit J
MLTEYAFWFLTFVAIFSAIGMILSKNPVYSVLSLIVTFFAIAGHYFLMNAQFLAAVHIIVYAGAIMVLFLYVIMMLNLNKVDEEKRSVWSKALAVLSFCILLLVTSAAIGHGHAHTPTAIANQTFGTTETLGLTLYKDYLVAFEISSVLFLAAMVGAVYLSKKEQYN